MTIREAIKEISKGANRHAVKLYICEVDSVNEDDRTCDVTTISGQSNLEIPSVQLCADGNDGFIQIPKIGSTVLVGYSLETGYNVLAFSDVDRIISNQPEFIFNGGDNGGLVIIGALVNRLNAIEQAFSQHVATFNSHFHTSPPAPVNPVVTAPPTVSSLANAGTTKRGELENTSVKH